MNKIRTSTNFINDMSFVKRIIKKSALKTIIKNSSLWKKCEPVIREKQILSKEKKKFRAEAKECFKSCPVHGSMKDYLYALNKHRVTYGEYMHKFEYWRLNEPQREEFISCSEMQCIYRKMVQPEVRTVFWYKNLFLNRFSSFAQRQWLEVKKAGYEQFASMISQFDCIAKPIEGWWGKGVRIIQKTNNETVIKQLYDECVRDNILLEERVHACKEIESFHPSSLNTVRVVTISNPQECVVFGAILRMGTGDSIIDNTHNGGIFASIDVETGVIETDGLDANGNIYPEHPDSHIPIKGFQIPHWEKVLEVCSKATKVMPKTIFVGWDVVIFDDGRVGLIEGNHAPDFDGGMQAPKKEGVKQKVKRVVMDLYGIDPLQFISVYSKTMNGYRYFDTVIE